MRSRDMFLDNVASEREGIFLAGTVSSPKSIGETLNEGIAAADRIAEYLNRTK